MQKLLLTLFVAITCTLSASAQSAPVTKDFEPQALITPYSLKVGFYKTTVLVFPAAVNPNGIDRGSADIIAKPVPGVENILKVKASRDSFPQTNLTVVTTDGKLYSFTVDFSSAPPDQPVDIRKQQAQEERLALFQNRVLNDEQVMNLTKTVAIERTFLNKKNSLFKIRFALRGIYTCEDVLCYRFELKNNSTLDYTVEFPRFYIRDKKRVKRTAQQEDEIVPVHIYYETGKTTRGKRKQTIVVAFSKFTIADKKNFVVQLFEKGGDRHVNIKIDGSEIVKARKLPVTPVVK
jgi:conjugative transposon TraN protein